MDLDDWLSVEEGGKVVNREESAFAGMMGEFAVQETAVRKFGFRLKQTIRIAHFKNESASLTIWAVWFDRDWKLVQPVLNQVLSHLWLPDVPAA